MSESEYDELLKDLTPEERVQAVVEDPSLLAGSDDEIPPEPLPLHDERPLAVREADRLSRMTPAQKARYDASTADIMSQPAVKAFAASEAHHDEKMEHFKAEFLKAHRKAVKEKA